MPKKSRSFALKGKPNSGITLLVAILVIASLSLLFLCGTNCCISCGLTPTGAAAGSTQGGGVYEYFYNGTSSEGLPGTGTGILSGGDGSPGNPYQISTCAELSAIRNNLNANYIITNNIVCTGLWSPIGENPLGTSNDWFKGVLDGQDFTVSGGGE